ncbi:MAG TPA: glucokinase [Anaerolineaceae bacterium]|nr:glucokinase [Chloroflexota bacterium]HNY83932.1 glucokinase [Anaerolineaceae bacterium]
MNILIGDIGGTKTHLASYSPNSSLKSPEVEAVYPSAQFASLAEIIHDFERESEHHFYKACFGVAGPIVNNVAHITNLPWQIDAVQLKTEFEFVKVHLLNDLEALAYAIPILQSDDLLTLFEGESVKHGNLAVIAPGTGLGEGFLSWNGSEYRAHPSEGSHVSFAPIDPLQIELLAYLFEHGYEHVSYERVCSGSIGIPLLYKFFKETGRYSEPSWLARELAKADDPSPVIFNAAMNTNQPADIAQAVLSTFTAILASEAGNLALKVMATGGVYIGGGIPPRILSELRKPEFLVHLKNKGRFVTLLSKVPVKVILNSKAGLLGAAAYGMTH